MNQNKDASIMNKDYVWNPRDQVMTKIADDQAYTYIIMIIIMPSSRVNVAKKPKPIIEKSKITNFSLSSFLRCSDFLSRTILLAYSHLNPAPA